MYSVQLYAKRLLWIVPEGQLAAVILGAQDTPRLTLRPFSPSYTRVTWVRRGCLHTRAAPQCLYDGCQFGIGICIIHEYIRTAVRTVWPVPGPLRPPGFSRSYTTQTCKQHIRDAGGGVPSRCLFVHAATCVRDDNRRSHFPNVVAFHAPNASGGPMEHAGVYQRLYRLDSPATRSWSREIVCVTHAG